MHGATPVHSWMQGKLKNPKSQSFMGHDSQRKLCTALLLVCMTGAARPAHKAVTSINCAGEPLPRSALEFKWIRKEWRPTQGKPAAAFSFLNLISFA